MRVLELLLIILAYVQPPSLILQLRTFDVPMMALFQGWLIIALAKKT